MPRKDHYIMVNGQRVRPLIDWRIAAYQLAMALGFLALVGWLIFG